MGELQRLGQDQEPAPLASQIGAGLVQMLSDISRIRPAVDERGGLQLRRVELPQLVGIPNDGVVHRPRLGSGVVLGDDHQDLTHAHCAELVVLRLCQDVEGLLCPQHLVPVASEPFLVLGGGRATIDVDVVGVHPLHLGHLAPADVVQDDGRNHHRRQNLAGLLVALPTQTPEELQGVVGGDLGVARIAALVLVRQSQIPDTLVLLQPILRIVLSMQVHLFLLLSQKHVQTDRFPALEDFPRPGLVQGLDDFRLMMKHRHTNCARAGGDGGTNAVGRILEHELCAWIDTHATRRFQEHIRRRLQIVDIFP